MWLTRTSLLVIVGVQLLLLVTLFTVGRQRELLLSMQLSQAHAALNTATADFGKCNRRVAALEREPHALATSSSTTTSTPITSSSVSSSVVESLRSQLRSERAQGVERERLMLDQLDAAAHALQQCRDAAAASSGDFERLAGAASAAGDKKQLATHLAESQAEFGKLRAELARCKSAAAPLTASTSPTTLLAAAVTTSATCDAAEMRQLHMNLATVRDDLGLSRQQVRDCQAQVSILQRAPGDDDQAPPGDCPRALLRQYPTVAPVRALEPGITLAMHLDKGRAGSIVRDVAPRWPGPIVLAVFATSSEDVSWIVSTLSWIEGHERIRYSIFMYNDPRNITAYPVNYMRNQALLLVRTELYLLLDGDFIVDAGLYARFSPTSSTYAAALEAASDDEAFIVPCFFQMNRFAPVPADKAALFTDTTIGGPSDPPGRPHHGLTDYAKWRTTTADYSIDYGFFYEPYLVQATRRAPFWDERFVYYGFDKVMYIYVLKQLGFRFTVLANHFAVHKPHPRDPWYEASGKKASDDVELHQLVDRVLREWGDTENLDWRTRGVDPAAAARK